MRFLPLTLGALALLLSPVGCKKSNDKDGTSTGSTVVPPTNKDSSVYRPPQLKIVNEVRFRAFVAWDPVLGEVVSPIIDGSDTFISAFIITLYEDGWIASDDSSFCEVVINLEGTQLDPAAKGEGFAWGMNLPAGPKEGYEDCTTKGFDVVDFPDTWKVEQWNEFQYTFRFYSALTPDLADWLTPATPTADFDINQVTGGDWSSDDAGRETDADSNYWYGYAMDDLHNVDFDTRLDARYSMLNQTGDMVLGYYVFDQNVYWYNEDPS